MESWLENFAATNFRRSSDTAHDLKTPLNVAVLNLELLRMRISKVAGGEDEKVNEFAKSIELEMRRMARIFDAFFVLSTPPSGEGEPEPIDLNRLCSDISADAGFELKGVQGSFTVYGHDNRIRQALKLFFEGASRVLLENGRTVVAERSPDRLTITITGLPASDDFEPTKIFKFYYSDAAGNADLSLASARLIAETYGGEVSAVEERDKVSLRVSFPGE